VVTTGESVVRETEQPGAILTRVAASHLRVGTFQYVSKWGLSRISRPWLITHCKDICQKLTLMRTAIFSYFGK
jgi:uncharacterized protein YdiU (UPF0061 family)